MRVLLIFVMCFSLLFSAAYAAKISPYKDVPNNFWGLSYIERIEKLKIINRYANGNYGVNDKVTTYAALLVIYRTLNSQGLVDQSKKEVYKNRYQKAFKDYGTPSWEGLQEAIGYFIEKKIIKPEDLARFKKDANFTHVTKEETALYLGRTLNLFCKEDLSKRPIIAKFADQTSISSNTLPYVNFLYDNDIVSGDSNKKFNPKEDLTRIQITVILSKSIDFLDKIDARLVNDIEESSRKEENVVVIDLGEEESNGVITNILETGEKKTFLYIKGKGDKIQVFEPSNEIVIKDGDGKSGTLKDLENGDSIKYKYKKNIITYLEYEKKNRTISGILKRVWVDIDQKLSIEYNGKESTFKVGDDVKVSKNGQKKTLIDLKEGDSIELKFTDDKITEVIAKGELNSYIGYITKILQATPNIVTIKDDSGKEIDHSLSKDVEIVEGSEKKSISDLKLGDRVLLTLQSGEVSKINIESSFNSNFRVGDVVKTFNQLKTYVILVNEESKEYNVQTSTNTVFIDKNGDKIDFEKIKVGFRLFVYGSVQDNIIGANKILVLEDSK